MGAIESLSKKVWYEAKQSLQSYVMVCEGFEISTIRRNYGCIAIYGEVSVWFTDDCKIRIWNVCRKCSGMDISIDFLIKLQKKHQRMVQEKYRRNRAMKLEI